MAKPSKSKANPPPTNTTQKTLASLKEDLNINYKLKLLLHDLHNIKTNPQSEKRTLQTTDELYISPPYFTAEEAVRVKGAFVCLPSSLPSSLAPSFPSYVGQGGEGAGEDEKGENNKEEENINGEETEKEMTVQDAIQACLKGFLEKRKASGDSRPCGPHDLGPVYGFVFGIRKEALLQEGFLGRVEGRVVL